MDLKTCGHCVCWRKIGTSYAPRRVVYDLRVIVIAPGDEGQCRAGAPAQDFRWPLTSAGDSCELWRSSEVAGQIAQAAARAEERETRPLVNGGATSEPIAKRGGRRAAQ